MILHTVAFRTKHEIDSAEEQDFLSAGIALSDLPMVKNFKCYRQVSSKNNFDYGFSMEFESESDYKRYNGHPIHQDFVEQRWLPEVEDFLELDYVDYDGA